MGLTLGLLLGIPGLLLLVLRRFGVRLPGQPAAAARLAVVSRLAVDAKHSLILFRRDSQEQLILIGPAGVTVLDPAIGPGEATAKAPAEERRECDPRRAEAQAGVQQVLQRMRLVRGSGGAPADAAASFAGLVEEVRPLPLRRHLDRAA